MSEPDHRRSSALSYLGAFTLGLVCMAVVVLVVQSLNSGKTATTTRSADEMAFEAPEPGPTNTFAHRARSLDLTPREEVQPVRIRKTSSPPPKPVLQPEEAPSETQPPEIIQPVEIPRSIQPQPVVAEVAAVIGGPKAGSIIGRALLSGNPPKEKPLPFDASCGRLNRNPATTRFYATSQDGGLADVFVIVTEGLPDRKWQMPPNPLVLRETGCRFEPYISGTRLGQQIQIENSDPVLHNAHVIPNQSKEFNYSLLPKHSITFVLSAPELFVRVKCDVHSWEFAYISVVDHPFFAVTDATGRFALPSLPQGKYVVQAYHRKAGMLSQVVEIEANESRSIEFTFSVPTGVALN